MSRREDEDGCVIRVTLMINEFLIMVNKEASHLASVAPKLDGRSCLMNHLYGDEVDTTIDKAVAAGAKVLQPAAEQYWGDRVGGIMDPSGHVWNIATRINKD